MCMSNFKDIVKIKIILKSETIFFQMFSWSKEAVNNSLIDDFHHNF